MPGPHTQKAPNGVFHCPKGIQETAAVCAWLPERGLNTSAPPTRSVSAGSWSAEVAHAAISRASLDVGSGAPWLPNLPPSAVTGNGYNPGESAGDCSGHLGRALG
jgi:hypothetical protein